MSGTTDVGMEGREDKNDKGNATKPPTSDDQLEALEDAVRKAPSGFVTFLAEMMLDGVRHERNVQRWKEGGLPESVDQERLAQIYSRDYPQHVTIAKESLAGIRTGHARSYGEIDQVADAIATAVVDRLPRKIDAYRYGQDGAIDEIDIPELGKVTVRMSQTGNGIFSYVSSIEGPNFKIRNCRQTGRQYEGRWNDIARPNEIKIDPLDLEIHLYEDDSGIFLKNRGLEYSNSRVRCFGSGYQGDSQRDAMYPTRRGFRDTEAEDVQSVLRDKGYLGPDSIAGEERFRDWSFSEVARDPATYEQFVTGLGRPFQLSWKEVSHEATRFLDQEVLAKILATPANENQATTLPEPTPYPEQMGTLYTWVSFRRAEKIEATEGDPNRVKLDERDAISVGYRLVSLGTGGDYPRVANDGFIWCGIGEPSPDGKPDEYMIPGHHMDSTFGDYRNKLVRVTPKHGEDMYVVDYKARGARTDVAIASTIVPINEYQGNFEKPVVLIGRGLELDEVQVVPGLVYGER